MEQLEGTFCTHWRNEKYKYDFCRKPEGSLNGKVILKDISKK
jgi:hypothetical protein